MVSLCASQASSPNMNTQNLTFDQKYQLLCAVLQTHGLKPYNTTADGTCQYGSTAHSLNQRGVSNDDPHRVKQRALRRMGNLPEEVSLIVRVVRLAAEFLAVFQLQCTHFRF
jgi:hypothetical protein